MESNGVWFNRVQSMREPKVTHHRVNHDEKYFDLKRAKFLDKLPVLVVNPLINLTQSDLLQYKIVSYNCGNALLEGNKLTWEMFESVYPYMQTKHPITNKWTTTFLANNKGQNSVLIAVKK